MSQIHEHTMTSNDEACGVETNVFAEAVPIRRTAATLQLAGVAQGSGSADQPAKSCYLGSIAALSDLDPMVFLAWKRSHSPVDGQCV